MKALLLIEDDGKALEVERQLKPLGFEAVRYRNPLKALDNLEEVAPDAIIASALDFPRHWKIIADVVRSVKTKHECVIILLRGLNFGFDEADKATYLGVNGIVSEELADPAELAKFQRLLKRYTVVTDAREDDRQPAADWDRILFLFSHPVTTRILGGRVLTISATGIAIAPSNPELVADLAKGSLLEDCSLRLGDSILGLSCTVARTGPSMGLTFDELLIGERQILESYLAATTEREIHARSKVDVDKS